MATRDEVRARGLSAYERGRVVAAARFGWVAVPVAALCSVVTGANEACGCLGVALVAAAVALRWKSAAGERSVRLGFTAGVAPLAAGLALPGGALAVAALGVVAGGWLSWRAARAPTAPWAAVAIAALVGAMGSASLGAGMLAPGAGLLVGAAVGFFVARR